MSQIRYGRRCVLAVGALGALPVLVACAAAGRIWLEWRHDDLVAAAGRGNLSQVARLATWDPHLSRVGFEEHYTPLCAAVCERQTAVVSYLLGHGADPNGKDDYGKTALSYARSHHDAAIEKLLVAHGAR